MCVWLYIRTSLKKNVLMNKIGSAIIYNVF